MAVSDFDFLKGRRRVLNRRLQQRLAGCDEWDEFELGYEFSSMLAGQLNVDRLFGELGGKPFEGVSVRSYDPVQDEWTIYWADCRHPRLTENVRGRFVDGVGLLYGVATCDARRVIVRFRWELRKDGRARWEQAYFDLESDQWETNWTMDFPLD